MFLSRSRYLFSRFSFQSKYLYPFYINNYSFSSSSSPSPSELSTFEQEEQKQQEKMRLISEKLEKESKPIKERINNAKNKYATTEVFFFLGITGLFIYIMLRPQKKGSKITCLSPYDPNLYYVQLDNGEIKRYYIKKAKNLSYVTQIDVDEDLYMNGEGRTYYKDGTLLKYNVINGSRTGKEQKIYPNGYSILYSQWENIDDAQSGLKYTYYNYNKYNPLDVKEEIFMAEEHTPVIGGFYSQVFVNGDKIEGTIGTRGSPDGSAILITPEGDINYDIYYENGELCGLSIEYLNKNKPLTSDNKDQLLLNKNIKEETEDNDISSINKNNSITNQLSNENEEVNNYNIIYLKDIKKE